jgi:aspartyl-tRNA(Asn)/glutamyl-tRNA(Gln) amidotransferase subunit A
VLERGGWQVRQVQAPWLDQLARWEQTLAVIVAREAHLVHARRDTAGYAEGTRALLDFGATVTDAQFEGALAEQAELTAGVQQSMAGLDALIGPAVGYQAPEQDPPFGLGDDNAEGRFTGPYNLTGHPALSLPVPVPAGSLPVGMQFAARRGADATLLQVAAAAERLLAAG